MASPLDFEFDRNASDCVSLGSSFPVSGCATPGRTEGPRKILKWRSPRSDVERRVGGLDQRADDHDRRNHTRRGRATDRP